MCIATVTACNSTHQYQFTPLSTMDRLAHMIARQPMAQITSTPINVTSVATACEGTVKEIRSNYGFIDFSLDEATWEKTLTKNGARCLPVNVGKLFFFENELGCSIADLKVGDHVSFNVKHVKTTNKLIAANVAVVQQEKPVFAVANQLASSMCMEVVKFTKTAQVNKFTVISTGNVAKVLELCHSHGYIQYQDSKIGFHYSAMYSNVFTDLKQNDQVTFNLVRNNQTNKLFAQKVSMVTKTAPELPYLGHFIDMQEPTPVVSAPAVKFLKTSTNVFATISSIKPNYAILNYEGTDVVVFQNNFYNTILSELAVGDEMKLSVVYNQDNGKYLGRNVQLEKKFNKLSLGHFQMMEVPKAVVRQEPKNLTQEVAVIAKIMKIGMDYALLEYAVGEKGYVYMHESSLIGTHISELNEGVYMKFNLMRSVKTGIFTANNVEKHIGSKRKSTSAETPKICEPYYNIEKSILNIQDEHTINSKHLLNTKSTITNSASPHRSLLGSALNSRRNSALPSQMNPPRNR